MFYLPTASKLLSLSCTQLHYLRLPKDISEDHVILMDCTVSTGAAAMMAVRVLLVRMGQAGGLLWSNLQSTSHSRAEGMCLELTPLQEQGCQGAQHRLG